MKHRTFIFCLLLGWPLVIASVWAAPGRILILNSDAAIAKYGAVEKEFRANLSVAHTTLDLGKRRRALDPKKIKHTIQNYDPDVIYCIGTKALTVAKKLVPKRKRVFSSVMNWRRFKMDGHTFGVSNDLHVGMQVTLFRYLFPKLKKIGIFYSKQFNRAWVELATQEAVNAGIKIMGYPVEKPDQLGRVLDKNLSGLDAIWLIADPVVLSGKPTVKKIFRSGEKRKKPIFAYSHVFARFGATLILSVDLPTIARQAAMLAENLARGQPAPEERVQEPAGSRIALNKKKIARYGFPLNKDALGAVNTFIE